MTHRTRTIFFLTLTVFFLITAFLVVSYSFGWRFDWKTKKITQPGIFYFKILPKNAQIYLNGKLKKKTDFFFGSALINNLLPRKYKIEVKKKGFYNWEKSLEIKERQVTEAKSIVLIPKTPKFTEIAGNIDNAFFSPGNKKIILKEAFINNLNKFSAKPDSVEKKAESSEKTSNQDWALKLFDINKNLKSQLIKKTDFSSFLPSSLEKSTAEKEEKIQLADLKFSPDLKKVLLKIEITAPNLREKKEKDFGQNNKNTAYYLLEIDKTPAILIPLNFSKNPEKIYFNPQDSQKLFILSYQKFSPDKKNQNNIKVSKELKEINLVDKEISLPVLKNIIACQIVNNNIYYLDISGFLIKSDLSLKHKEKLNQIPLPLIFNNEEKKYNIAVSGSQVIVKQGETLYLLLKNGSFQKISDSVKSFRFSPDLKKLVYFKDHEIWILFLEKKYSQPQKEKGEKLFLTRFSGKINNLFWYTDAYLIFNIEDKIKIAEIDDRDKINIVQLASFESPKMFWNHKNNKLYILSEKKLFSSEKLIP